MPIYLKIIVGLNLLAFLLAGAFAFYEGKRIVNQSDGFKRGFARSVGPFGLATVINTRHALCPPWVADRYVRLQLYTFPAFAAELAVFAVVSFLNK